MSTDAFPYLFPASNNSCYIKMLCPSPLLSSSKCELLISLIVVQLITTDPSFNVALNSSSTGNGLFVVEEPRVKNPYTVGWVVDWTVPLVEFPLVPLFPWSFHLLLATSHLANPKISKCSHPQLFVFQLIVTVTFEAPFIRFNVQYSQRLTWFNPGSGLFTFPIEIDQCWYSSELICWEVGDDILIGL